MKLSQIKEMLSKISKWLWQIDKETMMINNEKLTWNGMPLILDENSPDQPLLLSNTKDGVVILNTITGEKLKIIEQQIVYTGRIEDEHN